MTKKPEKQFPKPEKQILSLIAQKTSLNTIMQVAFCWHFRHLDTCPSRQILYPESSSSVMVQESGTAKLNPNKCLKWQASLWYDAGEGESDLWKALRHVKKESTKATENWEKMHQECA